LFITEQIQFYYFPHMTRKKYDIRPRCGGRCSCENWIPQL